ncbi:MAG: glycosyltransferase family 9 protein [Ignavibacteria bacterium]|nr:glycosyltransferase family 9 protein [Ignavibacteria bacterium]
MTKLPFIHFDCKYFYGDRPCKPNKEFGIFCDNCNFYNKDNNITEEFREIPPPSMHDDSAGYTKIVIIKLEAVGDVLRTTSILPGLKEKYPDSNVTWITKERSFEVLKDHELIDEIYFTTDELSHVFGNEFDVAINLDSSPESCTIMNLITSKLYYGYTLINKKPYPVNTAANEWYLMGVNDNVKKQNKKTYHRIIHEICMLPYENSEPYINLTPERYKRAAEIKRTLGLENFSNFILINLGGGTRWQYKKWNREGYIELAEILSSKYPGSAVGVIAGEEDIEFYNSIEAELKILNRANLFFIGTGNSLEDFICIVSLAAGVFTSDSLCFHISTALGKFTVVVVGPTSNTELDVFGNGNILFSDKLDCLCCYLNTCPKEINCMNTISAERAAAFFDKLI